MSDDNEKVIKLVQKNNPSEKIQGVNPKQLLKEAGSVSYDSLILVGWSDEHFRISWSSELTPEEVFLQLELAKTRIMANMYEF